MGRRRHSWAVWAIWGPMLLATFLVAPESAAAQASQGTIVIAVRHAERADAGADRDQAPATPDPPLSDIGEERARCLARSLEHAGVTRIFSTDYQRTLRTAQPVAELLELGVERYDPRALDEFAARLRTMGGVVLVVGHSNTTPSLVGALGGDPVSPVAEDEYERLYTVFVDGGQARSTLTRFCPAG